jgi:uncharacterized protein
MNAKQDSDLVQGFGLRTTLSNGQLEKSLRAGRLPAQGELSGQDMPRLLDSVVSVDSPIRWSFSPESSQLSGGRRRWWLTAAANVSCTCERCLMTVSVALAARRGFEFLATAAQADAMTEESMAEGPQGAEDLAQIDYLSPEDGMTLATLIEDELLLNLPIAPKHSDCQAPTPRRERDPASAGQSGDEPQHARALSGLKNLLKKS